MKGFPQRVHLFQLVLRQHNMPFWPAGERLRNAFPQEKRVFTFAGETWSARVR